MSESPWREMSLDNVTEFVRRGTAPSYVQNSSVHAIGQRCVMNEGFNPDAARPHDENAKRRTLVAKEGDVLLNSTGTGTIGRCCLYPGGWNHIVDGHVTVVRCRPDRADGRWVAELLRSPVGQNYLETQCFSGSTNQVELSRSKLAASRWPIPSIVEQRQVAEIIDTIDDAIRVAERVVSKDELLRRAVLSRIFGDSRWRDDLETGRLADMLEGRPRNGHSPVEATASTGRWLLGLGCLTVRGFEPRQLKHAPRDDPRLHKALLADGDLLVSRSNTRDMVGLVGRYQDIGSPVYYPDLMMRLVPRWGIDPAYLEIVLQSSPARYQIVATASGTSGSMVKINGSSVMNLVVPLACSEEQSEIISTVRAFTASSIANRGKVEKLRKLRAGLAADILSGKVRTVKDVEARI